MNEEEALQLLREELEREVGTDPAIVVPEADLIDDLDIDSIGLVELVMKLEDRLGITIDDDVAGTLKTVGDVVRLMTADSVAAK